MGHLELDAACLSRDSIRVEQCLQARIVRKPGIAQDPEVGRPAPGDVLWSVAASGYDNQFPLTVFVRELSQFPG